MYGVIKKKINQECYFIFCFIETFVLVRVIRIIINYTFYAIVLLVAYLEKLLLINYYLQW
jgi:hypothetical protein